MSLKSKIADYFKTYWKNNVTLKSISVIVTGCFLINISNLPAFAKDKDDALLKKRIKNQKTNSGILYQGDQKFGSVAYMQLLQNNTKVDDNDVILVKNKNGKFEAKGYWDPQTQHAMTVGGDGKYIYNETLTKVVKKIKGIVNKTAEESADVQSQEEPKIDPQTTIVGPIPSEQQNSLPESKIDQKNTSKSAADIQNSDKTTTKEPNKSEVVNDIEDEEVGKDGQKLDNQNEKYNTVIENLMKETGLNRKEIETEFAKLTDKERSSVINALYNLYSNNQSIVYCASEALGKVLNQIGAGMLAIIALGLIIADAIAGLFVENNKDLIADTSNQLYISAQAMQTVLAKYGKDYKGYTATIDDIVKGLGLEESIVVHVGANHFITVIKNEDGTFTLFDINRSDKKVNLGSQEELNVLLSIYLQGNISTTVLAKPNSIFTDNKLKSDLSKVIGATTYTPNDLITDTQKASDFYLGNGDKSYLAFMKLMFSGLTSSTQLTHGQSLAFAQAYKTFLEKALEGLCKKASGSKTVMDLQSDIEALNDKLEKEKDGSKKNAIRESIAQKETDLAKARQDQQKVLALIEEVVYEKTIIEKVNEILNDPKYNLEGREEPILSGQLGQVLIPGISFDMPKSDDIPEGTYYLVMSITASHVGTKNYEYGNGKGTETNRDIPEYRVYDTDIGRSLSTMEGGAITLADGSTYKVFGIAGKLEDQSIIFEYFGYYRESTKEFFISQSASVYLANSSASLYQEKQDPTASPPQSGKYGSAAPKRNNWSRGIITEDDNGYTISGAGSRVTIRRDSYKNWKPVIVGMGTDALAGSKLKLGSKNESGQDNNVYINIIAGKMTYTGVYWAVSDGMSWSFNSSTTQEEANVYLTNVLRNQLSAGENKDFVGSVKLKSGNVDKSKTFYGMPFSALDIMHECGGIEFSAELKSGFVYDATSKGDIFKTTLKENTIVAITEKENMLNYLATSDVAVSIELSQSWKYGDNTTSKEGIISAGKEISLESFLLNFSNFDLPSILDWLAMNKYGKKYDELGQNFGIDLSIFNSWGLSREQREIQLLVSSSQSAYTAAMVGFLREKGLYVVNTENMEMVSGYEDRVDENGNKILDIDGNPRLDFDKPITSTIGIGKLQISVDFFGNTKGYVLFDNVRIKFTNTGWLVDNDGSSGHYWQRGAQVSVTGTKDDDGKISYKASITKGNLYVSGLDNVHIPKPDNGGNNNDKPPYDGPTFNGSVTRHSNDGSGGHYFSGITGTFFGISGINLTRDGLGDYLYAPGSNFSAHSYAPDGTKSKYRFYMKDDGTIQQIGVPWYAKLWGWVKAIAKIVVTFIVAVILVVVASFLIAVLAALFSVFQDFFLNLAKDWFASIYDDWNRTEDSDHTTETAWKGGMAMLAAGVMAIITAVIALASIVSAVFTGGATLAVGIAAVIGMISAIAGVVQVAQMTYQAVLCIAYGNIGAGLAMLAIALVLAIVTMVGANGVGNAISAGLQSVAFVLKAALIGAVIGSAIGAGVGALGGYIANGVSTGEWSGDGAADAAANGAISGAIAGAFAGASIGISIASTIAKQAAKTAAEAAAETIGESVGAATGQAVGVSFSQGMSFLGQSIKGFLTSVNFVAVEGIKSVVVNIGKAVAHVLKIALKLASMALDMYVTYKSAESMFDAIEKMVEGEEGALEQFLSALWTLISINLIAPFMSGQQGIQSKEDIEAAAKAEVDAAQLEKLVQTPKDAINKLEIVKGELSSIFVGWSTWGSHILTGAIGAGLGVGAVYLIAWLNNETLDGIDWKDIVIGASIGFGVGMAASMFSRLFGNINIGTKIVDSIKKTLGQLTGYSESSGIRSLANFAKVWGSGLVGSVIGALLVPLIAWLSSDDNEDNDDNNYLTLALIGAGVGLVIGLGFGGAWINGKFENLGGRLKETIFGKLSDSESGQLPLIVRFESPIAANALKMSINMSIMNTRLAFASAIGQKFLIKIGLGDIVTDPDGALVIIDKVTGMGLLEKGTSLNDSNFSKEAINDVFLQSFEQMTNPQMIVFSSIVQVLQPILTPALLSSPGLGTIMDPIVAVGESGFMKNEAMSYLYENGIKERLVGVVGKLIFGDSMAGEIFQELFDEMPDDIGKTKMEQLEFLASHGFDADNVIEATRILKADPLKFKENIIETFNIIGINMPAAEIDIVLNRFYESCGISLKDIENVTALQKTLKDTQIEIRKEGISKEDIAKLKETESKIKKDLNEMKKSLNVALKTVSTSNLTRFILNEVIIYKIKENNFFKTSGSNADGEDEIYAKMIKENVMQVINSSVIPEGLSVNEQINYLYASAGLVSFGINPKSIGQSLTTVEIEEIMKTARENGKQQLAAEYLLNYAANVSKTPGREQEMLAVADILVKMVDDIDAQNITAKTLFMTQYLNVLVNSMETATEFKNLANLGVRTQGQQQRFEELQVYLDIQNTVDNLFNVVGKHMVETFKNSQGLKDARTIALASLDSRTPDQQKEFDALNLSDGEIEVLKKLYSTQTLALNNYINMLISKVEAEEISHCQFRALMDTSDDVYFKGGNATTNEYRVELRKLMAKESSSIISSIDKLLVAKQITKEEAVTLKEQIFFGKQTIAPTSYFNIAVSMQARIQNLTPATEITIKMGNGNFKTFSVDDISEIKITGQNLQEARLQFKLKSEQNGDTKSDQIDGSLRGNLNSIAANSTIMGMITSNLQTLMESTFLSDAQLSKIANDIVSPKIENASHDVRERGIAQDFLLNQDGTFRTDIFDEEGKILDSTVKEIENAFSPESASQVISIAKTFENLKTAIADVLSSPDFKSGNMELQDIVTTLSKSSILEGVNQNTINALAEGVARTEGMITLYSAQPVELLRMLANSSTKPLSQISSFSLNSNGVQVADVDLYTFWQVFVAKSQVDAKNSQEAKESGKEVGLEKALSPEALLDVTINDLKALQKARGELNTLSADAAKIKENEIEIMESKLNWLFEGSGYADNLEALLPRSQYLKEPANINRIKNTFSGTGVKANTAEVNAIIDRFSQGVFNSEDKAYLQNVGIVNFVQEFLNGHIAETVPNPRDSSKTLVIKFADGTLDLLRSVVLNMEKNGLQSESANILKTFMIEANRKVVGFGLRASQSEMVSHFQNNDNVAVGMGGGKTISIAIDAIISRVLMGKDAKLEILVGNEDLDNFASTASVARKLFESLGMRAAKIDDFKPEGHDTDLDALKNAYNDPDTIVIMSPTTRGHLKNEAVSKGGTQGQLLNDILNSVNRVTADEIHLWALTRTASVIGGDNQPPETYIVKRAMDIGNVINASAIFKEMLADGKSSVAEASITMPQLDGRQVTIKRFKTEQDLQNATLQGDWIAIVGEQSSSLKIKMSDALRDDIISKIKPTFSEKDGYNAQGRLNSVIMGLFSGSDNGGMKISQQDGTVKPVGQTGIQENMVINDIYRQLGFTLRVGLEEQMSSIETKDFMKKSTKTSSTSMQTSLAAIYAGARDVVMVGASGTVDGLQQLIVNRTGAAKVYNISGEKAGVEMFKEAWNIDKNPAQDNRLSPLGQQFKTALENGDFEGMNNFLFLAKTQASFEMIRQAVKENYETITSLGVEIYEFTDRQGKWTDSEGDLVPNTESLSVLAKTASKKRLVIANEMGATGIDYQGNFANVLLDTHLMSDADLAQALKRTGRPGPNGDKTRWDTVRIMAYGADQVTSQLNAFNDSVAFRDKTSQMWSGDGYMNNPIAAKLFNTFIKDNNMDLSKMTPDQVKEVLILVSNIRSLYDIDASIRFAVTDSIRDKMVLGVLRDLVATMPEGTARDAVQKELNAALESGGSLDKGAFSLDSMKAQSSEDVVLNAFQNVNNEVKDRFTRLTEILSGDKNLKAQLKSVEDHMAAVDLALDPRVYFGGEPVIDKGLSSAVDLVEFVSIIRSFEDYIMPLETVVDKDGASSSVSNSFALAKTEVPIMTVLQAKGSDYVTTNENNEEVLTAKGKLLTDIQQKLSNNKDNSMAWLMFFMALLNLLGLDEDRKDTYLNVNPQNPQEVAQMANMLVQQLWDNANLSKLNELIGTYDNKLISNGATQYLTDIEKNISVDALRSREKNENKVTAIKLADMNSTSNATNRLIDNIKDKIAKDSSLSTNGKLTPKGRMSVKIAEGFVNQDKDWIGFLKNGPLGQFISNRLESLDLDKLDEMNFAQVSELVDKVTNDLWESGIWDVDKVNELYGWYRMMPAGVSSKIITTLPQLKGILAASHSPTKKQMAEQQGISLPSAMETELAKLSKDFDFPQEFQGYKKFLESIVERDASVEAIVTSITNVNNFKSDVSVSKIPPTVRGALGSIATTVLGSVAKYRLNKLKDSIRPDISEIFNLFPELSKSSSNTNEFAKVIKTLMMFAGIATDKTDPALDNFSILVSKLSNEDRGYLINRTDSTKALIVGVGSIVVGAVLIVATILTAPISIPLLVATCVGLAITSFFASQGILKIIGKISNTVKNIMDGDWFKKLSITDIDKFGNLRTTSLLINSGTLDIGNNLFSFTKGPGRLINALNGNSYLQDNNASVISKEERILILGKDMSERMDNLKAKLIKKYAQSNYYKDIESDKTERLALVEREFKWDMEAMSSLIFENADDLTPEFADSSEFKSLAKNLLVVMYNDVNIEKNYDLAITRLQKILKANLTTVGVVAQDQNITIDNLTNNKYFNGKNDLESTRNNLARSTDQALKNIRSIESKIDRDVIPSAGRRLVAKMGEGFTKPGEMQVALLKALCYFKDIDEMKNFINIDEDLGDDANIAQKAFDTYKESLESFTNGDLAENEFNEVLELIRIVASTLMLTNSNHKVAELINAQNRDYDAIHKEINGLTVGVKAHVFVNVFQNASSDNTLFEGIDINKLKTQLEKKDNNKGKRILSGNIEELNKVMKEKKLKIDALTSIRNSARAVAAAA